MAIPNEARSIAMRAIARISERVTTSSGLNKERWLQVLERYMAIIEPMADKTVKAGASRDYYHDLIEQYIRNSKDAAVENLNDLDKIKRQLRKRDQIVQIKDVTGRYVAKKMSACSPLELDTLAEQYERSSAADARRARFCRLLARQMRLAGLDDRAPLSELLAI
jgi:hypothetical protein